MAKGPLDADAWHGDTVVASIVIDLHRSGAMNIRGSITDEAFTKHMLDTAQETLKSYHARRRMGLASDIVVPANETALVGTPEEKLLLKAREDLAGARDKCPAQ